jgi:hypothetical protein
MRRKPGAVFVIALIVLLGGVLVVLAQDHGSAAIGLLSMGVTVAVAALFAPDPLPARLFDRRSIADLRRDLLARLRERSARALAQARPDALLLRVPLEERVRVATRARRSGSTTQLGAIFDATDGRLVVIGAPGAGKTTGALSLFAELMERATASDGAVIPFVVNLSTWSHRAEIDAWLAEEIARVGQMSPKRATALLPQIAPILDGLDEVPADRRIDCAAAIARYADTYRRSAVVVFTRVEEFEQMPEQARRSLPVFQLEPLTPEAVAQFFEQADAAHWHEVTAEIRRAGSPLAAALSTVLMVSITFDGWSDDDPAPLAAASLAAEATEDTVSAILWQRWVDLAQRRSRPEAPVKAAAVARAIEDVGSIEVRAEELGGTGTIRAWYLLKILVLAGLTVVATADVTLTCTLLSLCALVGGFGDATSKLGGRVGIARRRFAPMIEFGVFFGAIGLALVALASGSSGLGLAVFGAVIAIVLAMAPPVAGQPWLRRRTLDQFSYIRAATVLALLLIVAPVIAGYGLGWSVLSWREWLPFVLTVGIFLASFAGLDLAGQHWLARARYGWKGVQLRHDVAMLAEAGFLRSTGAAFRFFHRELQAYLANNVHVPRMCRFENVSDEALFANAVERFRTGESVALWDRYLSSNPSSAAALGNRAIALEQLHRWDEAEDSYRRSLAADAKNVVALANYGEFLWNRRHDVQHAAELFERALELDHKHVNSLVWYGTMLLEESGDTARARELLEAALEHDPRDASARRGLDELAQRARRQDVGAELPTATE